MSLLQKLKQTTAVVHEAVELREFLDSAREFYMTDDTKLPFRIFAAFQIEDTDYGIALEETNFPKVYELRLYRIVNVKPRRWAFKSPSHIRPALATLLKFAEASMPFVKQYVDGIVIPIPSKIASDRYNRFVELLLKRTYIKTFRHVPVMKNFDDKDYTKIFLVRKVVQPQTLFNTKAFKAYSFDVPKGTLPSVVADDIELKRIEKPTVTLEPSKKFSFLGFEPINVPTTEVLDELEKIQNLEPGKYKDNTEKVDTSQLKEPVKKENPHKKVNLEYSEVSVLIGAVMPNIQQKIIQYGYDESKFDAHIFAQVLHKNRFSMNGASLYDFYKINNYYNPSTMTLTDKGVIATKSLIQRYALILKNGADGVGKTQADIGKSLLDKVMHNQTYHETEKNNEIDYQSEKEIYNKMKNGGGKTGSIMELVSPDIDIDKLKSTLPGVGSSYVFSGGGYDYGREPGESEHTKVKFIEYDLKYKEWFIKYKNKGPKQHESHRAMKDYTGSQYSYWNPRLRNDFREFQTKGTFDFPEVTGEYYADTTTKSKFEHWKQSLALMKMFDDIEPFPESMWLYRGTTLPDYMKEEDLYPGNFFVDAGFVSSAVHSTNTFGLTNVKVRIFVPKGSKVLPVLNVSSNAGENEVILPPLSAFKIIKYNKLNVDSMYTKIVHHITVVYLGHTMDDMRKVMTPKVKALGEKLKAKYGKLSDPTEYDIMEAKKPSILNRKKTKEKKYDPNEKFAAQLDKNFSKSIMDKIKSGEYKLKK